MVWKGVITTSLIVMFIIVLMLFPPTGDIKSRLTLLVFHTTYWVAAKVEVITVDGRGRNLNFDDPFPD